MTEEKISEIILYKDKEGPELRVNFAQETVWLTQAQVSELFGTKRPAITKHLRNIFNSGELQEKSVCSVLEHTAKDGKTYKVQYYNLDAVLAVGYRVNSKRATQFRIWATQKLHEYLQKGFIVNEQRLREANETRLKELQQAHLFIKSALEAKRLEGYEKELISIINDYTQTWVILNRYDEGDFEVAKQTQKKITVLDYVKAKKSVEHLRDRLMDHEKVSGTFGREKDQKLLEILSVVENYEGNLETKAAYLFYEIIKTRPFIDGNKRIASLLFVVLLVENHALYDKKGERKFNDNALIALALLVEETKPSEKQTLLYLISNLIRK